MLRGIIQLSETTIASNFRWKFPACSISAGELWIPHKHIPVLMRSKPNQRVRLE